VLEKETKTLGQNQAALCPGYHSGGGTEQSRDRDNFGDVDRNNAKHKREGEMIPRFLRLNKIPHEHGVG